MKRLFDNAYENFKQFWIECQYILFVFSAIPSIIFETVIKATVHITFPLWVIPYKIISKKHKGGDS